MELAKSIPEPTYVCMYADVELTTGPRSASIIHVRMCPLMYILLPTSVHVLTINVRMEDTMDYYPFLHSTVL